MGHVKHLEVGADHTIRFGIAGPLRWWRPIVGPVGERRHRLDDPGRHVIFPRQGRFFTEGRRGPAPAGHDQPLHEPGEGPLEQTIEHRPEVGIDAPLDVEEGYEEVVDPPAHRHGRPARKRRALIPGRKKYAPPTTVTKLGRPVYRRRTGSAGTRKAWSGHVARIGSGSSYRPSNFGLLHHVPWMNSNCRAMLAFRQ